MLINRVLPVVAAASGVLAAPANPASPSTSADGFKATNTANLEAVLASTPQMSEQQKYVLKDACVLEEYTTASNITAFSAVADAWIAFEQSPLGPALQNSTLVHAALQYVVANGVYDTKALQKAAPVFLTTHLYDPAFSQVTGGQVVKIDKYKNGSLVAIQGLNQQSNLITETVFDGGVLHIMESLFVFPQDLNSTANALTPLFSVFSYLLSQITPPQVSPITLSDVTIFLPASKYLSQLQGANGTSAAASSSSKPPPSGQYSKLDAYTVAGAPVEYSTTLKDGKTLKARDGSNIKITSKGGNFYANGKEIIQADSLVSNGVVHIIDGVF